MRMHRLAPFVLCSGFARQFLWYYAGMAADPEKLPTGRVTVLFNQDYGQREFHVCDEDCMLIFFGEAVDMQRQ
jgi:hypothetical protein